MSLHQLDGVVPRLALLLFFVLAPAALPAQTATLAPSSSSVPMASPSPTLSQPSASPASPQADSVPTSVDAGSVAVQADAFAPSAAATGSDIIVLEGEALKSIKARNAADLLRDVAGVFVSDYGTAGGLQGVSIRGSSSAQVVIVVDGQRQNNVQSGGIDLSHLGADQIDRIEILRGGASAAYGSDAVGGVIYITTHKANKNSLHFNVENRSHFPLAYRDSNGVDHPADYTMLMDGQHIGLAGTVIVGDGVFSLSNIFDGDQGKFTYLDDSGITRQRDQVATLVNRSSIGFDSQLGGGKFSAKVDSLYKHTGVPGSLSWLTPAALQDERGVSGIVGWKTDSFFNDNLDFNGQVWGNWSQYKSSGFSPDTISDLGSVGVDLKQSAILNEVITLAYGLSGRFDTIQASGMINSNSGSPERLSGGLFVNPILKTGILTLSPSLRFDVFSDVPAGLTASFGTDLALSDYSSLWLSLSRSYRAPTFNDLYWPADAFSKGNPNLSPESAWSGDLGLALKSEFISSRSSVFVRYVQDGIDWLLNGGIWTPSNIHETLYPGFDQDFTLSYQWLRLGVNYEFLHSFLLSEGYSITSDHRVAQMPDHKLKAHAGIRSGGFECGIDGVLNSQGFWDLANSEIMPAWFVLNANIAYWFSQESSIYLAVDNVLNARYQIVNGYPMPGIGIRIGLNLGY